MANGQRWHISKTGEPARCHATPGHCPLSSDPAVLSPHFTSKKECENEIARRAKEEAAKRVNLSKKAAHEAQQKALKDQLDRVKMDSMQVQGIKPHYDPDLNEYTDSIEQIKSFLDGQTMGGGYSFNRFDAMQTATQAVWSIHNEGGLDSAAVNGRVNGKDLSDSLYGNPDQIRHMSQKDAYDVLRRHMLMNDMNDVMGGTDPNYDRITSKLHHDETLHGFEKEIAHSIWPDDTSEELENRLFEMKEQNLRFINDNRDAIIKTSKALMQSNGHLAGQSVEEIINGHSNSPQVFMGAGMEYGTNSRSTSYRTNDASGYKGGEGLDLKSMTSADNDKISDKADVLWHSGSEARGESRRWYEHKSFVRRNKEQERRAKEERTSMDAEFYRSRGFAVHESGEGILISPPLGMDSPEKRDEYNRYLERCAHERVAYYRDKNRIDLLQNEPQAMRILANSYRRSRGPLGRIRWKVGLWRNSRNADPVLWGLDD